MKRTIITYLVLLSVTLLSCKPKQNMVYMSRHNMEEEVTKAKFQGLHIQEGDVLLILVAALDETAVKPFNLNTINKVGSEGNTGINQYVQPSEYLVNEEGYISFPVLGNVYTKGMTQIQLKQELESRLKRYLTDPMVSITLKNFNVSVLGEVKNPGQKESVSQKINVFQALGLAGDMTDYGDRTNVKLIRTGDDGVDQIVNVDLSRSDIVNSPYYYMKQNDILYVQPDKNKQVQANTNPNRALTFQIIGALLTAGTLIIALTR
ncbi:MULTISPECIES: polysaccharide biosynthesis/export family protein [Chryseobacterium]|nr:MULTISPECIES: polysaccharide biosynthesis/export family protein [Chryseobacterium]MBL3546558.1 polysaccharide biosynthesis/export family protein [Chryseobacterium sp. KMC2]MDC8099696.1 polysaccharide biosynthesis/export family protein [Chryseobacterium rhizosphaerae]MDR6547380.1 polysaccharide export outer membrane protein [Chryseobacterium rhizosphaerae]SMC99529.1 polysaccharide export outer membrane protein [Chryseobacterium sp. YR221]